MAYPGCVIIASSNPMTVRIASNWMSSGKAVAKPLGYTSLESFPSGSRNIWWRGFSANLKNLSSIEGQYLGPVDEICPEKMGDLAKLAETTSLVLNEVYVR